MKRRSRQVSFSAVNYWPGYVDALTNVVLNLLFLIAMFATALAVINSAPRGSPGSRGGESARRIQVTVNDAPEGTAVASVLIAAEGFNGDSDSHLAGQAIPVAGRVAGTAVPTDRSFAVGARREDGALARPATQLVPGPGGPRGSAVPPGAVRADRVAPASGAGRGADNASLPQFAGGGTGAGASSTVATPGRVDSPGRLGRGYPFAGLPPGQLSFSVVDAYQRQFLPGVRVLPREAAGDGVLLTIGLKAGIEPVAALAQPAFGTTLRALLGPRVPAPAGRVRLWTATRLADPAQRRTAYLALLECRNQLLALGYPALAIEVRLIEGSAATRDEKLIYLLAVPAGR